MEIVKTINSSLNNENLSSLKELSQQAKAIPREQRKDILSALNKVELYSYLKNLFKAMQPNYIVEMTANNDKLWTDLIIIKKDAMTIDAIGVVIKEGNIMSKTLVEANEVVQTINEIIAFKPEKPFKDIQVQFRKMFDEPTEIEHATERFPMNKVFLILTGIISKRGRSSITNQTHGPVEIFDVNWLTDNFTEFYPQIFFEGKVTDWIQSKIQEFETKSWHNKENKNLSDCYVEPLVQSVDVPLTIDDAKLAIAFTTKRLPFSKLRSIVSSNQRIILVGDPGTGKSAALAKLSIEMLRDSYSSLTKHRRGGQKPEVPIFITAKNILKLNDIDELLLFYFTDGKVTEGVNIKVLMIDALDEVPSNNRQEIIDKASRFSSALDCSLILTSRKIDILNSAPIGFRKYELLPFEANQALKLFEKIHGKDQLLHSLKLELNKIRYAIPMVPLSLMLLIELVEQNNEVPASLTELYERYTDTILGRYDKNKGIEVLFDYTIKKRFLAALAYKEFLGKSRLEIPRTAYELFLEKYAEEYNLDSNFIKSFVEEIERAGALKIGEAEITFGHRSFLDYFAALYVFNNRDELENINDFIIQKYFDDFWGDTVFFYVGQKKEVSENFLSKVFGYEGDNNDELRTNVAKFLVGRLLQAGWHSTTKTKIYGIQKAFELVPEISQGFLALTEEHRWRLPKIFAEFFLLIFTNHSYRSSFLSNELKAVFKKSLDEKSNFQALVPLLWAMKPFIDHDELNKAAASVLDVVASNSELSAEEKGRTLLMLKVLERGDKDMTKAIEKKIKFIQEKNPGVFQKLLPKKVKGSIQPSKKRSASRNR